MPPDLDIYCLTRARNRETIERFLDEYVDRAASEDRGDEELMMVPLGLLDDPRAPDSYDWKPAKTLSNIIACGLERPSRAFVVYLRSRSPSIDSVMLGFTVDDQMVLGVSVDDADKSQVNSERAESLMHALARSYGAHHALVAVEQPAPRSEAAFVAVARMPGTLSRWEG